MPMIPAVDIAYIAEELRRQGEELRIAFEDRPHGLDSDPRLLLDALDELLDSLRAKATHSPAGAMSEPDPSARERDMRNLGGQGLDMLTSLAAAANSLQLPEEARQIERLALPLACWIARQGGEVRNLIPVVEGAAGLANSLEEPAHLEGLYGMLTEVADAVSPQIVHDTASADPTRPWRILLINRAIVATRSHQPTLMTEAFDALIEHLPDEVSDFFGEGMNQMEVLSYPPHVRAVMERYYTRWCRPRVLH